MSTLNCGMIDYIIFIYIHTKGTDDMKKSELKELIKECIKEEIGSNSFQIGGLGEAWTGFNPSLPVVVVGVDPRTHKNTENGHGYEEFPNFEAAKKVYPELEPNSNGKRFTSAMKDRNKARFETWQAYQMYSV